MGIYDGGLSVKDNWGTKDEHNFWDRVDAIGIVLLRLYVVTFIINIIVIIILVILLATGIMKIEVGTTQ